MVPSHIVVPGLGSVGTLATVWALWSLLWVTASWLTRRVTWQTGTGAPRVGMVVFAVAVLAAYVASARRDATSLEINAADRGLILLAAWTGVVLVATSVDDIDRLKRLLRILVGYATVAALIALAEFYTRSDLLSWLTIPGLQSNAAEAAVMTRGEFTRPTSTAIHPLELATLMAMILPFAVQQAFDPATRGGLLRRWAPVGLIGLASVMTVSRTAVIGIVLVLLILIPAWDSRRRWPAFGILLFAAGLFKFAVPGFLSTVVGMFTAWFNGTDSSANARVMDYEDVFGFVAERPWAGMGFGTFLPSLYRYTDNMYLLALVEMGIIGVSALLVLFFTLLHCAGAARRRLLHPVDRELALSFVACGAVVMVCTATFDTLSFPMVSGLFFLVLGLSGAYLGIAMRKLEANVEIPR